MPEAVITSIAKAVLADLNAADLSQEFTAERVHVPVYDTSKAAGLKVFVVASGRQINLDNGTRSDTDHSFTVSVGVYNQISRDANGQPTLSEVDAMDLLVQEICDLFVNMESFTGFNEAFLASIKNETPFDPASLNDKSVFVSVIALTFEMFR